MRTPCHGGIPASCAAVDDRAGVLQPTDARDAAFERSEGAQASTFGPIDPAANNMAECAARSAFLIDLSRGVSQPS